MFDREKFRPIIASSVESGIATPNNISAYECDELNNVIPGNRIVNTTKFSEHLSTHYLIGSVSFALLIPFLFYLSSEGSSTGSGYSASLMILVMTVSLLPLILYFITSATMHVVTKKSSQLRFHEDSRESKLAVQILPYSSHPQFYSVITALLYQQLYREEWQEIEEFDVWNSSADIAEPFSECIEQVIEILLDAQQLIIEANASAPQASVVSAEIASSKILMKPIN